MRVDKEFVLREIAGDYIIIPTGKTVLEFNGLITVNEVGVSIWNMLQKEVTFDKLVQGDPGRVRRRRAGRKRRYPGVPG